MKGWGCKRIDFFIPLFFASDTQKDLDRSLYGMPWKNNWENGNLLVQQFGLF